MKQNFVIVRKTPLSALRAAQSEFSSPPRRRQGAMAGGALCLPPRPLRLPLLFPKNLTSLRFSGALFIFQGTPLSKCRGFTFPARAAGMRQIECAYRKARLSDAQEIVCIVLTISFELTKEKVVRQGGTCRARGFAVLAAVSPLCGSSRQGAMADGALCLPPCPPRLPLLFPKNLALLRFSGALFVFRARLFLCAPHSPPSVCS